MGNLHAKLLVHENVHSSKLGANFLWDTVLHHASKDDERTWLASQKLNLRLATDIISGVVANRKEDLVDAGHGLKQDFRQVGRNGVIQCLEIFGNDADLRNASFVGDNGQFINFLHKMKHIKLRLGRFVNLTCKACCQWDSEENRLNSKSPRRIRQVSRLRRSSLEQIIWLWE